MPRHFMETNMRTVLLSLTALFIFGAGPLAAEDLGRLPIITLPDVINALEDRCPCVDIIESEEEEAREENSPLDELEDATDGFCRANR